MWLLRWDNARRRCCHLESNTRLATRRSFAFLFWSSNGEEFSVTKIPVRMETWGFRRSRLAQSHRGLEIDNSKLREESHDGEIVMILRLVSRSSSTDFDFFFFVGDFILMLPMD